ncbi:MFS transporter [Kitasatospora sp. NPDC058965]|uniref:MFS transporter n=1 Tax=Kitasatospora sp. NPDC058965 TaxID=3346682 RepID=UPI003695461E
MTGQPYFAPYQPPVSGQPAGPPDGTAVTPAQVLGIAALVLTQALLVLGVITTNISLPQIQHDLFLSVSSLGWLLTAYTLPLGALPLVAGRLGEVAGRKLVHLIGIGGFTLASFAASQAHSVGWLLTARAGQGVGAALSTAGALALLERTAVSPRVHRIALGCYFTAPVAAFASSVLLGGLLVEYVADWRQCFLVFAVAGLVLSVVAAVTLPETGRTRRSLDLVSGFAGSAALLLLSRGLARALDRETPPVQVVLWFLGAALLLAVAAAGSAFVRQPARVMLTRFGAYAVVALLAGALFGSYFSLTLVLQSVYGYSPLQTGAALLPSAVATVVAAAVLPQAARAIGIRWVALGAAVCAAAGLWWISRAEPVDGYAAGLLPPLLLLSFGAGGAITVPTAYARGELGERGARPAGLNSARSLGMSLGIVLIGGVTANAAADAARTQTRPGALAAVHALHTGSATGLTTAAVLAAAAALLALLTLPGRGYR